MAKTMRAIKAMKKGMKAMKAMRKPTKKTAQDDDEEHAPVRGLWNRRFSMEPDQTFLYSLEVDPMFAD